MVYVKKSANQLILRWTLTGGWLHQGGRLTQGGFLLAFIKGICSLCTYLLRCIFSRQQDCNHFQWCYLFLLVHRRHFNLCKYAISQK